jgi:hypothetical protein
MLAPSFPEELILEKKMKKAREERNADLALEIAHDLQRSDDPFAQASSLATLDILKFLGKFGTAHSIKSRIGLWTHTLEIEKQHNQENPSCITCIQ